MLSIIIPSYKDPALQKTINSLLENAEGEIEIIAVLDGYKVNPPIKADPRVRVLLVEKNLGMRNAVNVGVKASRGDYIMKSDAHCKFGPGFDRLLLEGIENNWVVVPRQYKLDINKWEVLDGRGNDYSKLLIDESKGRFTCIEWFNRTRERKNILIDETMCFQGSCWLMSRKWWNEAIGELQESGYGTLAQEPVELVMKTFMAGGKMIVNKKTWYAHKHRDFGRTHPVPGEEVQRGNSFSLQYWRDDYSKFRQYFGI